MLQVLHKIYYLHVYWTQDSFINVLKDGCFKMMLLRNYVFLNGGCPVTHWICFVESFLGLNETNIIYNMDMGLR